MLAGSRGRPYIRPVRWTEELTPTPDLPRAAQRLAALADLGFARADVAPVAAAAVPVAGGRWKVLYTRPAMGTLVSVTLIADSRDRAATAIAAALGEMDRLIALLSRHDPDSVLSHLNRTGRLIGAPPELMQVVTSALAYHHVSRGAFEMTVTPLLDLVRAHGARSAGGPPSGAALAEAAERVGSSHVRVGWRCIGFARAGMAATLDGIAKGYIVDAMAAALERHGVRRYLVNAGGDMRTAGTREDGGPWTVAVRDPAGRGVLPVVVRARRAAVATSGSYELHFRDDLSLHHLVDARSGGCRSDVVSVSVVAPAALAADALATSVFVLGPADGIALVDRLRGCACLVIGRDGRQWTSRRWRGGPPEREGESVA